MVLSHFVPTKTTGSNQLDLVYFAYVTATTETGSWWWKKSDRERVQIAREFFGNWFFVESGKFCPGHQAEDLERAYNAQRTLAQ